MLLVEGATERGTARQKTLPVFFHRWLDPKLPDIGKLGITAVNLGGIGNYLNEIADRVERYLSGGKANMVFGLVDLYGLPQDQIDLASCVTVEEKVKKTRKYISSLVPKKYHKRFRQYFAVHEVEAWLLAYPDRWPEKIRGQIEKKPPEEVNFKEPPSKFLSRLLSKKYQKTVIARNFFPNVDPDVAYAKCPYLKHLLDDLLAVAVRLQ